MRIVRIATHPNAQGRGYGSRAMELLTKYFEGALVDFDRATTDEMDEIQPKEQEPTSLAEEKLKPRKNLKPILQKLSERKPAQIHYLGTSFGVTKELFQFWKKNEFLPIYLRQTANELTGEHSCIMIKSLNTAEISLPEELKIKQGADQNWVLAYSSDFQRRFANLLGYELRKLPAGLALNMLSSKNIKNQAETIGANEQTDQEIRFSKVSLC